MQPSEITISVPNATTCGGPTLATRVFVYGGTAPYQVDTTQPTRVSVSDSQVDHPGGSFDVTLLTASCLDSVSIVVTDKLGRQAIVSVNSVLGS